jgi:phosphoribosylformylglycinamidine synthase
MAFAGRCGIELEVQADGHAAVMGELFAEELGALLQVREPDLDRVLDVFRQVGLGPLVRVVGRVVPDDVIRIVGPSGALFASSRTVLREAWSETSYLMQSLRDNPDCAREEYARATDPADPGLSARLSFDPSQDVAAPYVQTGVRPRVAILREQGVNSQVEMAAAFHRAGFEALDVHMTDLISGRQRLEDFRGLVACGGFSYGDVLGAGEGWAKSILFNPSLRDQFGAYFEHPETFTLGICNGCQMLSALKPLVPGAEHWPRFVRNRSEQFEGRASLVEVQPSPSIFLAGMAGSVLPIAVAHGEGRAEFADEEAFAACAASGLVSLRFVDNFGRPTESYPANPNGSPQGITGLTSRDGRATILMPHPERVFRSVQNSWRPDSWGEDGGWLRMFRNARVWIG